MTIRVGLNKVLNTLQPLSTANKHDTTCYAIVGLLDDLIGSQEFTVLRHTNHFGQVLEYELIPTSNESHEIKAKLSDLLIELTEPLRTGSVSNLDFNILTESGYTVATQKTSMDEWAIAVTTRHGIVYVRFIEA